MEGDVLQHSEACARIRPLSIAVSNSSDPSATWPVRTIPGGPTFAVLANHFVNSLRGQLMNNVIYIVGLVVVVIAVLSFFGLR
jgi:hypothetical protein